MPIAAEQLIEEFACVVRLEGCWLDSDPSTIAFYNSLASETGEPISRLKDVFLNGLDQVNQSLMEIVEESGGSDSILGFLAGRSLNISEKIRFGSLIVNYCIAYDGLMPPRFAERLKPIYVEMSVFLGNKKAFHHYPCDIWSIDTPIVSTESEQTLIEILRKAGKN